MFSYHEATDINDALCSFVDIGPPWFGPHRGMSDSEVESQTRSQYKYGCLHGVFGTPTVSIGGVFVDGLDGESTFQDWQDLLEPLLGRPTTTTTAAATTAEQQWKERSTLNKHHAVVLNQEEQHARTSSFGFVPTRA